MWYVWERVKERLGFFGGRELRDEDHLEDLDVYGRIILKRILKNGMWTWTGLMWPRIRTSSGLW
jgi:hypothetical protein